MTVATPSARPDRFRGLFSNLVSIGVILFALPWLWWAIVDRQPIATRISEVVSTQVRQGESLDISYDVTWNSRCQITAFRYIIDAMQVEWPITQQDRIVEPGPSRFTIRIPIPLAAAPGEAIYRADIAYRCNPLQRFFPLQTKLTPRHFTILPGPNPSSGIKQGALVLEGAPLVRQFVTFER